MQTTARAMDAYASVDSDITSLKQPCIFDNVPFASCFFL